MTDFPLLTSEYGVSSAYYFDGQVFAHIFLTACSSERKRYNLMCETYLGPRQTSLVEIFRKSSKCIKEVNYVNYQRKKISIIDV